MATTKTRSGQSIKKIYIGGGPAKHNPGKEDWGLLKCAYVY